MRKKLHKTIKNKLEIMVRAVKKLYYLSLIVWQYLSIVFLDFLIEGLLTSKANVLMRLAFTSCFILFIINELVYKMRERTDFNLQKYSF